MPNIPTCLSLWSLALVLGGGQNCTCPKNVQACSKFSQHQDAEFFGETVEVPGHPQSGEGPGLANALTPVALAAGLGN